MRRTGEASSHQVGQVGMISAHELPLLADGRHPLVDGLVEVLPHVVLQVVSVVPKKKDERVKKEEKKKENHKSSLNSPTLQPLGDEEHGGGAHVFGEESLVRAELALAHDVVKGGQGLAGGPVHVGRDEMHEPVVGPLTPLHLLSGEMTEPFKIRACQRPHGQKYQDVPLHPVSICSYAPIVLFWLL